MTKPARKTFIVTATETFLSVYRYILKLLGYQTVEQADPGKFNTNLCIARAAHRVGRYTQMALPESLLQAFSAEPLVANDERFIGRVEQLKRFYATLDLWRAGQSSMVAVTGPQGCGITSFLQQLTQHVGDDEIF